MLLDIVDGIARIGLDQPELGNVLSTATSIELGKAVDRVAADPSVRVLVLWAAGPMFCAGGDIREFVDSAERLPELIGEELGPLHATLQKLATLPVPVIAALNGPVAGGGLGLALTADILLANETVRFRSGYVAIGLSPDAGTSFFITRLLGPKRAAEFFMTNRFIEAPEALALGLISRIVPADQLAAETTALAERLAAGPRGAHAAVKRLVREAATSSHEAVMALERELIVANAGTPDTREGMTAFLERRRPAFAR